MRSSQAPFALDYLFPSRCFGCGERLGRFQQAGACLDCWASLEPTAMESAPPQGLSGLLFAFEHEGFARKLLLRAKQGRRRELFPLMARFLSARWRVEGEFADCVVSAPSTAWRTLRRGFAPAADLADRFSALERLPHLTRLRRAGWRPSQKRLGRSDRTGIIGKIRWTGKQNALHGRAVLLIDDVSTTGATLSGCAHACRSAGAQRVTALSFSKRKKLK